ncbi:retrovirus-related pol polyprotein from transposon TNT 1-94 [Tanacetum coccineum]
MLKVSPWKGVVCFGKRGKLNPRYVRPFQVLAKVRAIAYKLELPQELSRVRNTFHVSNLKKCYADEPLSILLDGQHIDDKLHFVEEPVHKHDREGEDQHEESISTAGASMPVSTAGMVQEQEQERLGHEAAVRLQEELDEEETQRMARVHEAAQSFTEEEWENIKARFEADEELSKRLQAEERNKYSEVDQAKMLVDLINQRKKYFAAQKAKSKRNKPMTQAQQRNYMINYIKQMGSHTLQQFRRYSFDEIKELFETTMKNVNTFIPMETEVRGRASELAAGSSQATIIDSAEVGSSKRAAEAELDHEDFKRQKTNDASGSVQEQPDEEEKELSQEDLQQMMMVVPVEEVYVELKRLFEPNTDDTLWKLQRYMHDPLKWRLYDTCTVFRVSPYLFNYPTRRITMEEILAKFIDEGKREHEEMEIFIIEFRTTNELLLKELSNLLSELKIKVNELSKVMGNVLIPKNKVKGVTTRGGKMISETTPSKEINETGINKNEPPRFEQDVQEKPHDVGVKNKSSSIPERTTQPLVKPQQSSIPFPNLSLLTNKSRLEEACTVTMNERCSSVLLNKLSSKEKDPGSFTIPCQVSHLQINNALVDLGASISLMPYTMYKKLGLGEPKPTRMSLKLADRPIQYPRGIVKNVLIKVDKFFLPIDFVILDMPKDSRIPIIFRRSFLATARVMIDVFNKKITLRVGDDEVIFDMDQSTKNPPTEDDECHGIDDLDDTINIETQELLENDRVDLFLLKGLEKMINQSDLESNSIGDEFDNNSDVDLSIRRIDAIF